MGHPVHSAQGAGHVTQICGQKGKRQWLTSSIYTTSS